MIYSLNQLDIPIDIKKDINFIIDTLLEKFSANINKIILFGSYANNTFQPDSDIDIAAVLNELPDIKQRRLYKQALDLDREVDLVFCTKTELDSNDLVFKHINERGFVLYEQL